MAWRRAIRLPRAKSTPACVAVGLLLWVAVGLPSLAWGGAGDRELVCAPSATGCVTTWLVAGPMGFLRAEELERDFLGCVHRALKIATKESRPG